MTRLKDCRASGNWLVSVPAEFEEVNNGDSWQARAGGRIVYVSSLMVLESGTPVPPESLCASASEKLVPAPDAQRHHFAVGGRVGEVQIARTATGYQLQGSMCVAGRVALCVIDFASADERDWALSTWKSIRQADTSEAKKPWWVLW